MGKLCGTREESANCITFNCEALGNKRREAFDFQTPSERSLDELASGLLKFVKRTNQLG